jgi:hypothetical protein
MSARDTEAALLTRCVVVARAMGSTAQDQREANVFRVAAMVIQSSFPIESVHLMQASEQYFAAHPDQRLTCAQVVRNGWVINLPRLRDRLVHHLRSIRQ